MITANVKTAIDKYLKAYDQRIEKLLKFENKQLPFLVSIIGPSTFYTNCNTIEDSFAANLYDFEKALDIKSDSLPYLEPWFGTGLYANAFGCEYFWRQGDSPACHYKYKKIEDIFDVPTPDISQNPIFKMVLDAIEYFKDKTQSKLPICITDTQSPHDTATMIVDACEVFMASYSCPDQLRDFLQKITDLVIEFSNKQAGLIGECMSSPGHLMSHSGTFLEGMSISDDNLAVASPAVNKDFLLPFDEQIGKAMGSLALHSCGRWSHTMPEVAKMQSVKMIDCAISQDKDPCPNEPEQVREAFKGTDIVTQVRIGTDMQKEMELVKRIFDPDLRLVVRVSINQGDGRKEYDALNSQLKKLYGV